MEVNSASPEFQSANEVLGNLAKEDFIGVTIYAKEGNEFIFIDKIQIPIVCLDREKPSPLTIMEFGVELDILFNIIDDAHLTDEVLFGSFDSKLQLEINEPIDHSHEDDEYIHLNYSVDEPIMIEDYPSPQREVKCEIEAHMNLTVIASEIIQEDLVDTSHTTNATTSSSVSLKGAEESCLQLSEESHTSTSIQIKQQVWRIKSIQIYNFFKYSIQRLLTSDTLNSIIELIHSITDLISATNKFVVVVLTDLSYEFLILFDELITELLMKIDTLSNTLMDGSFDRLVVVLQNCFQALSKQYLSVDRLIQNKQEQLFDLTKDIVSYSVKKFHPLIHTVVKRGQPLARISRPLLRPVQFTIGTVGKVLENNSLSGPYYKRIKANTNEIIQEAVHVYEENRSVHQKIT